MTKIKPKQKITYQLAFKNCVEHLEKKFPEVEIDEVDEADNFLTDFVDSQKIRDRQEAIQGLYE